MASSGNRGFLPQTDAALLAWSLNFSTKVTATPTAYGLTAAQATAYQALHDAFASALAACDPAIRNKPAVATKNDARLALKDDARLLARLVQGTASVTDAQKLELGLNVRAAPSPIPAPSQAPGIDILGIAGRTVSIRLHGDAVLKRAKPPGCKGASVFSFAGGASAPTDPSVYKFEGNTTRTVFDVVVPDSVEPGTTVYITAMWWNERAESGPAATPVAVTVGYGMSQAAGLKLAA